jgi:hypothetical protein
MTENSENLVTIDFDSDTINAYQDDAEISAKGYSNRQKNLDTEIIFGGGGGGDSNLDEILVNESQPLLGGGCSSGDHEAHQIIYNQFPSKPTDNPLYSYSIRTVFHLSQSNFRRQI